MPKKKRPGQKVARPGKGKVARMPKVVRDRLNQMLVDAVPYKDIITRLGKHSRALTHQHITAWKQWGHQHWLEQQERLEDMRSKREFALEIVRQMNAGELEEAGARIAAAQIYDALNDFDATTLKKKMEGSLANYANILNSLFKLRDSNLRFEKYRAQVAEARRRIQSELERAGCGIREETKKRIEEDLGLL